MSETLEIVAALETLLDDMPKPLAGLRAVVTSGPTREPIDPVRYISNHSSGKQGHAIAAALAKAGAEVICISGPVTIADPAGCVTVRVETAREMQAAVEAALPSDIGVFVAAVADWRVEQATEKTKKSDSLPELSLIENPDILAEVGNGSKRPTVVVGFAAETQDVERHALAKLERKGADLIVANDVSTGTTTFGGDENAVTLVSPDGAERWESMSKQDVAARLVEHIAAHLQRIEV